MHDALRSRSWAGAPFPHAAVALAAAKIAERSLSVLPRVVAAVFNAGGSSSFDATGAAATKPATKPAVTPASAPQILPTPAKPARMYQETDLGNADYFIDHYGHMLRFDKTRNKWMVWRGNRWSADERGQAEQAAQVVARMRTEEAVNMPTGDPDSDSARQKAIRYALQSEGRARIENVLALAQSHDSIAITTAEGWDVEPFLLGVPNGVIDLRTGKLRAGRRDDQITKCAGVAYEPAARALRFEQFLVEVFEGDRDIAHYIHKAIGYSLTADVREQCWFGCYGTGANGKSMLRDAVGTVFGEYGFTAGANLVSRGRGESKRDFDIVPLQGKRFVSASEINQGAVWDESRMKLLTGGDELHAEIKGGADFNFKPTHKLWFMFNHQPRVLDNSAGFWRRVRLIPFNRKFTGTSVDKTLGAKLASERKGILAWAVRGCVLWQQEGLASVPKAVQAASDVYERNEDPLYGFVQQHVRRADGKAFKLKEAYSLYLRWCLSEHEKPRQKREFGELLENKYGFKQGQDSNNNKIHRDGALVFTCVCMQTPCVCLTTTASAMKGRL